MKTPNNEAIRSAVLASYRGRAQEALEGKAGASFSCCGSSTEAADSPSCCGPSGAAVAGQVANKLGYTEEQRNAVPDGANLGLGCGNPLAIATLRPGEKVLDLGSGGGFDCFLAADAVGAEGRVIGVVWSFHFSFPSIILEF